MAGLQTPPSSEAVKEVQDELLYLPSHFSESDREELGLSELGEEELELRRVQVVECIMQLRRSAKKHSSVRAQKRKDLPGQHTGTRAAGVRIALEFNQECLLRIYNVGREALVQLSKDTQDGISFPHLTSADLFRKPTTHKRQLGDSRRPDGMLWRVGARADVGSTSNEGQEMEEGEGGGGGGGEDGAGGGEGNGDGWADGKLWSPIIGLSIAEVEEWDREGKHSHSYEFKLTSH